MSPSDSFNLNAVTFGPSASFQIKSVPSLPQSNNEYQNKQTQPFDCLWVELYIVLTCRLHSSSYCCRGNQFCLNVIQTSPTAKVNRAMFASLLMKPPEHKSMTSRGRDTYISVRNTNKPTYMWTWSSKAWVRDWTAPQGRGETALLPLALKVPSSHLENSYNYIHVSFIVLWPV